MTRRSIFKTALAVFVGKPVAARYYWPPVLETFRPFADPIGPTGEHGPRGAPGPRGATVQMYLDAVDKALDKNGHADGSWNLRMRISMQKHGLRLGPQPPADSSYPDGIPWCAPESCDDEPFGWPRESYICWA